MEVSGNGKWAKPRRTAQTNAKKAIEELLDDDSDEDDDVSLGHDSADTVCNEKRNLGPNIPDVFVNVEVKVELNDENDDTEVNTHPSANQSNGPDRVATEGPLQAKTIVAKLAHKLNSKLNSVLTPHPSDSLLEYLEPEVSMATENSITSGGVHLCPWCPITSSSLKSLEEHKRLYHQVSNNKSANSSKSPEEVHTCEECGKTFGQSWRLKRHYIIHIGLRPFICVDCGEAFATGGELSCHQKNHASPKQFECTECDDTFLSSNELRCHIMLHAPYICFICGDRFFEEKVLLTHRESHVVERCWMCLHCDRGFSAQEILVTHQKSHFNEKPEPSGFGCDRCGKSFREKENLEVHVRLHLESRLCDLCFMVFPDSDHMTRHMHKRHKVDPPEENKYASGTEQEMTRKGGFYCLQCNRDFQLVTSLKHHLRSSHSMAKTYNCGDCGECFHDVYSLKGHLSLHRTVRSSFCCKCGENFNLDDWSIHYCLDQILYECPSLECGGTFTEQISWEEHIKRHEEEHAQRDPLYIPGRPEGTAVIEDEPPPKKVMVMARDTNSFKASIADKLKGTGFYFQKRNEADHFKDKIAGRLMGTGFVAEKKNEVNNFRDTIAERVKEVGTLSFGNGNVSLSLLHVQRENKFS